MHTTLLLSVVIHYSEHYFTSFNIVCSYNFYYISVYTFISYINADGNQYSIVILWIWLFMYNTMYNENENEWVKIYLSWLNHWVANLEVYIRPWLYIHLVDDLQVKRRKVCYMEAMCTCICACIVCSYLNFSVWYLPGFYCGVFSPTCQEGPPFRRPSADPLGVLHL